MTDEQIRDAEIAARVIAMGDWAGPSTATETEREAAMERLHRLRIETWRRGINPPKLEDAEKYRHHIARNERKLAELLPTGDLNRIYAIRVRLAVSADELAYINA
jgi:hypothetical protein